MTEPVIGAMFPRQIDSELSRLLPKVEKNDEGVEKSSFSRFLFDALSQVNEVQKEAERAKTELITGDLDDLHQLMIKTEEAKISLQLTVQTTTKIIEAYQELYRMQI